MISMILSMSRDNVIGKNNRMPWHLPADLAYFKKMTMGHAVIMGRKTYESIGKPLPGRDNVIITRDRDYKADGCTICHSIEEALSMCHGREVFVIGGADIYTRFLPYAGRLYITFIDEYFEGDCFFPEIDCREWVLKTEVKGEKNEKNPYDYYFKVYERVIE